VRALLPRLVVGDYVDYIVYGFRIFAERTLLALCEPSCFFAASSQYQVVAATLSSYQPRGPLFPQACSYICSHETLSPTDMVRRQDRCPLIRRAHVGMSHRPGMGQPPSFVVCFVTVLFACRALLLAVVAAAIVVVQSVVIPSSYRYPCAAVGIRAMLLLIVGKDGPTMSLQ